MIDVHSVEFYVVLLTVAALFVGLLAIPSGRGQAETGFLTGQLRRNDDSMAGKVSFAGTYGLSAVEPDNTPRVEFHALADGTVEIRRYGLAGLTSGSTVALAVTRIGFDISIEERITPEKSAGAALLDSELTPVDMAVFVLSGLAQERYHIKYNSDSTSSFAALSLTNRPGISIVREFNYSA